MAKKRKKRPQKVLEAENKAFWTAFFIANRTFSFEDFCSRVVRLPLYRKNVLDMLGRKRASCLEKGEFDAVQEIDNAKLIICEVVLMEYPESINPHAFSHIQTYDTTYPCHLPKPGRKGLNYYDNKRGEYIDRYTFGKYDVYD